MTKKQGSDANSSEKKENQDQAFFNVDSRLLFQLGEQLVSTKAKALAELVKNSYDADAKKAKITLIDVTNPGGTIIIEDNGVGISYENFLNNWMRIATTDSTKNPISKKFKRMKAGEKGIGRIACRKIAKKLRLETIYKNDRDCKKLTAFFDWDSFKPGLDVDKVPVDYNVEDVNPTIPTGTTLFLTDTIGNWTKANVDRLNIELSELYSPRFFDKETDEDYVGDKDDSETSLVPSQKIDSEIIDPGFNYEIITKEFPKFKDSLNKAFFDTAWAKLTGSVDENGKATYHLKVQNKVISFFEKDLEKEENFKQLRNSNIEIYFFVFQGTRFYDNSPWSPREASDVGNKRGGIRIYADKFRVFGYGDPGDDWLDLASERARSLTKFYDETDIFGDKGVRYGLALFNNTKLFGYVNYEKNANPDLQISITREKLEGNEVFNELKKFVRLGINFATVLYANEVAKKENEKKDQKKKEEDEKKAKEDAAIKAAEDAKQKTDKTLREAENKLIEIENQYNKIQKDRLENQKKRKSIEQQRTDLQRRIKDLEQRAKNSKIKGLWSKVKEEKKKEEDLEKLEKKSKDDEDNLLNRENETKCEVENQRTIVLTIKNESIDKKAEVQNQIASSRQAEIDREKQKIREEIATFRVLAATGTSVFIFIHEIQTLLEDMIIIQDNYQQLLTQTKEDQKGKKWEDYDRYSNRIEMVDEFGEFLGLTIGKDSRSKMDKWPLHEVLEQIFKPFKVDLEEKGIEYSIAVLPTLRTPDMYRSEVFAILLNFLTNSIKALKTSPTRNIEVRAFETEDENLVIQFLDTGKGLAKEFWDQAFEPFFTLSESDLSYGTGTGLGLKLVRDIVDNYGGDVNFSDPPSGWNTCIELKLPQVRS